MWGNGSSKLKNLQAGTLAVEKMNRITGSCFATEIRGLAKLLLGNKDKPRGDEKKGKC